MRRCRRAPAALVAACAVLVGVPCGALSDAVAEETSPAPVVEGVSYGEEEVRVVGTAPAGASVEVLAAGPQTTAPSDAPLAHAEVVAGEDGSFAAALPTTAVDGSDLRYASYTAATAGEVSPPHFVDEVTAPPRSAERYPRTPALKGLQVQLTDDAEELGVQSAAINVSLGEIMRTAPGEERIAFESGGATYWFDRAAVQRLDRQVEPLSDAGALVDLILLVYRSSNPDSAAGVLTHPDATADGTVMGFNTVTEDGVRHLVAATEFVAERYTRPDERHGRAVGFIVGNEVDAQWTWSNTGDRPLGSFLEGYVRALRLVWLATTKYWSAARTYVSLTHSWTRPAGPNPDPDEPTRYYPGRDLLDGLAELGRRTGDFPWHVAHHPYPQDLFDPTVWDDPDATATPDAPVVTFRNLDQLTTYLRRPALAYHERARRVILSEQGCHTPGVDAAAERLQAACYAYAYYRARFLPGIDSFILHRHVDHGREGGLLLGLWTRDEGSPHPAAPARPKLSHRVFRAIDTPRSLRVTNFALDVIGADSWEELIPGFDADALAQQRPPHATGSRAGVHASGWRPLPGTGWRVEHNVTATDAVDGGVRVTSSGDVFGRQWRGVGRALPRAVSVDRSPWLVADVTVPAEGAAGALPGDEGLVRLRVTTSGGRVVEADARLRTDGGRLTVAADLRSLPAQARLAEVQVWVRGSGTAQAATTFELRRVGLAAATGRSTAPNVLATGEISGDSALTLTLTGLDADPLRGRASVVPCGGWPVEPTRFRLQGLVRGKRQAVTAPVGPGAGRWACVELPTGTVRVPVEARPVVLEDFEEPSDAAAWEAGPGVSSVAVVPSIANGPGAPHGGRGALEATGSPVPPDQLRSVTRSWSQPLDLGAMQELSVWVDAYGGAVGATGYTATVVVTAADGTSVRTDLESFVPDRWNRVAVPLTGWAGRRAVASVTVGFRARGSTLPEWAPRFQVDDLAVTP